MKKVVELIPLLITVFCLRSVAQDAHFPHLDLRDSLDNLSVTQRNVDSLKVLSWSDSLKSRINIQHRLDSISLITKMDSVRNLGLPTATHIPALDSLMEKKERLLGEVEQKKQAALDQTKGRLDRWKAKVQEKLGVGNIPTDGVPNLPNDISLPDTDVNLPTANLPEMPQLSMPELASMDLSPDLSKINESLSLPELDGVNDIKSKFGKAGEALNTASSLTTNTDQVIDQSLNNVSQLGDVKEQLQLGEGITDNEFMDAAEKIKDPEALKEELKQQAVQKAVNHFEGKEQVLQEAMELMSKYKSKYENLNSLSEIKKLPRNAMKGEPFLDRFVPGVMFQILSRNDLYMLDINPYAGYRITGRLTAGLGWNQRIGYSTNHNYFTSVSEIYGPRSYAEVRVWRGFSGRVEFEVMNTVVPPRFNTASDAINREWVSTFMVGIKKEYRFIKSVRGTVYMMFNIFDYQHKSPYGDVLNSRFGFEFPMRHKSKKSQQGTSE